MVIDHDRVDVARARQRQRLVIAGAAIAGDQQPAALVGEAGRRRRGRCRSRRDGWRRAESRRRPARAARSRAPPPWSRRRRRSRRRSRSVRCRASACASRSSVRSRSAIPSGRRRSARRGARKREARAESPSPRPSRIAAVSRRTPISAASAAVRASSIGCACQPAPPCAGQGRVGNMAHNSTPGRLAYGSTSGSSSRFGRRALRSARAGVWRFWLARYLSLSQIRIGLAMKIDE